MTTLDWLRNRKKKNLDAISGEESTDESPINPDSSIFKSADDNIFSEEREVKTSLAEKRMGGLGGPRGNTGIFETVGPETEPNDEEKTFDVPDINVCPPAFQSNMARLKVDGTLVIPFDSPPRYHWWNGGQTITQTRRELNYH